MQAIVEVAGGEGFHTTHPIDHRSVMWGKCTNSQPVEHGKAEGHASQGWQPGPSTPQA